MENKQVLVNEVVDSGILVMGLHLAGIFILQYMYCKYCNPWQYDLIGIPIDVYHGILDLAMGHWDWI